MQDIEFHSTFSSPRQSSSKFGLCSQLTENVEFLSPHFELQEFTESATARKYGIDNTPPPEAVKNLRALCVHTLEPLREALGLPIIITSGYRCKALNNKLAHSSDKSQHMCGQAADFWVQGLTFGRACARSVESEQVPLFSRLIAAFKFQGSGLSRRELLVTAFKLILTSPEIDFDQLILYPSFIHVSFVSKERNRRGILLARGDGKLGYGRLSLSSALQIT